MLFNDTFTVPAGTPESAPVSRELKVAHGIIHLVEIVFLDGPENEVHVVLRRGLHRFVPSSPDSSIVGNADAVPVSLFEPVEESPFAIIIEAWSPDADYDHEISVRVNMLLREELRPPVPELGIISRLGKLIFGAGG